MRDVDVKETEISTRRKEQHGRANREIRAAIHMCASLFKVAVRKFGGSLGQKERREGEGKRREVMELKRSITSAQIPEIPRNRRHKTLR